MKLSVEYDPRTEIAPVTRESRLSYSAAGLVTQVSVNLCNEKGEPQELPLRFDLARTFPAGPYRMTIVIESIDAETRGG